MVGDLRRARGRRPRPRRRRGRARSAASPAWEATSPPPCWRAAATARSGSCPTPGRRRRCSSACAVAAGPASRDRRATFDERGSPSGAGHGAVRGPAVRWACSAGDVWGSRVEPSTGRRTFYVRRANELVGTGTRARRRGGGQPARRDEEYAVTVDATGRPVDLAVLRTAGSGARRTCPPLVQPAAGLLAAPTRGEPGLGHRDPSRPQRPRQRRHGARLRRSGPLAAPASGPAVDVSRRLAGVSTAPASSTRAPTPSQARRRASTSGRRGPVRGLKWRRAGTRLIEDRARGTWSASAMRAAREVATAKLGRRRGDC